MIQRSLLLGACALALTGAALGGCASAPFGSGERASAASEMPSLPKDPHSFARPDEARVTHVALDLRVDFEASRLAGTAALDLAVAPGARQVVLDTRDLDVSSVTDGRGRPLQWRIGAGDTEYLGKPLEVDLPQGVRRVVVTYATAPGAAALQWLKPEQTAGKTKPFLFSQGQSILTRTWIPTQDSPGVRQTYEARIVAPAGTVAVMSAEMKTPHGRPLPDGSREFLFEMDRKIPPYLIAIGVGDLAFQSTGPRTGVWAEPVTLQRAASELQDMEKMLEAAEGLYGPYRWGRYDVLMLPPSFPFGGMENPRLTFATPTILAGDRSLVSLIAHELAHSWSGNLVTNATWDDFWLNEGFTTYFENRIMEALYGTDRAAMLANLGWEDLQAGIADAGGPTAPDTRLKISLEGRDPDEGMADIAYEKGASFLRTIETTVGRERFDAWLRGYFDRHAFQPMTTERFLADIREHLIKGDAALEQRLQLERWVYQPGVPETAFVPQSPALAAAEAQANAFAGGAAASTLRVQGWTTQEWQRFLTSLPQSLPAARLADLDRTFRLSEAGNSEILFAWLQVALRNRYEPAVPAAERFLTGMGRRKFVAPLFRTLWGQDEWGRAHARRIYAAARPGYHSVTSGTVDDIVR